MELNYYWSIFPIIAVVIFVLRKDLRNVMILSGVLALPVLIIKPIITPSFFSFFDSRFFTLFVLNKIILSFSFGALASVIYEVVFHKKITPFKHPLRNKLLALLAGPIVFIILELFHTNFSWAVVFGLSIDLIIIIFLRKDLLADAIFSGFCMGLLYLIIFIVNLSSIPGAVNDFWFSGTLSKIALFSIPIEEVISVALFGALFGPLYIAIKDKYEK